MNRSERLLEIQRAVQLLADPHSALGQQLEESLVEESGLSREGVRLALDVSLEHSAHRSDLLQLGRALPQVARAHVLLSANVFVAAYRAILLGVAQGERTFVRASRRASAFPRALQALCPTAFELVADLEPVAGDHYWAYASDETLSELRNKLPAGVILHGHGSGMGAIVLREPRGGASEEQLHAWAEGITTDTVLHDQRGCLSPRVVLLHGSPTFAEQMHERIALALEDAEAQVPRGTLNHQELADERRYVDTFRFVGGLRGGELWGVVLDERPERIMIPPVGRYLHLVRTDAPLERLGELGQRLTCVAVAGDDRLPGQIFQRLGNLRVVEPGQMQLPPLDGPVDRRTIPEVMSGPVPVSPEPLSH